MAALNLKLRGKLLLSFIMVICFGALVGLFGLRGINSLNLQNEIGSLVNRALADSQDVEAAFLRFVIYEDESYFELSEEEFQNVMDNINEAREMMKNEINRKNAADLMAAMEAYQTSNREYHHSALEQIRVGTLSAEAEDRTNSGITSLFEEDVYRRMNAQGIDLNFYRAVEVAQELRNSFNRVRIWAQKYQIAVSTEDRDSIENEWNSEIENCISQVNLCKDRFTAPATLERLTEIEEALIDYSGYVQPLRQLDIDKRALRDLQRLESTKVSESARLVNDEAGQAMDNATQEAYIGIITILVVASLVGIIISLILTNNIMKQLGSEPEEIANIAEEIAKGNLLVEFDDRKELGVFRSMKNMTANLTQIMSDIRNATNQVSSGSQQISSSSQQISSGANEQASSTEEISSSMEELAANIQRGLLPPPNLRVDGWEACFHYE
ncbi:MAG: methyl-accepting chemotaxis protein, partial [Spirochaetaceae bacterium]|nr:methyl-accepting chemotaxis protein [Spirochaetaceae bacterium]